MEKIERGNPNGGLHAVAPFPEERLPQGDHRAEGVILLRREESPKSSRCMLLLRGMGVVWVSAPGGGGRFRGGTEPFTWGNFLLYQSPRSLYLKNVEIAEDFLSVRQAAPTLMCAARWHKELSRRLMPGHEEDALISLFWGSMKNLSRHLSPLLLDIRLAWRWANLWGVAPSLDQCPECGSPLAVANVDSISTSPAGFLCETCAQTADTPDAETRPASLTRDAFGIIHASSCQSAKNFVRGEAANHAIISNSKPLEKELKETARWFYSFL
jgi:DNA repair protein RecO (recombination protein O)